MKAGGKRAKRGADRHRQALARFWRNEANITHFAAIHGFVESRRLRSIVPATAGGSSHRFHGGLMAFTLRCDPQSNSDDGRLVYEDDGRVFERALNGCYYFGGDDTPRPLKVYDR